MSDQVLGNWTHIAVAGGPRRKLIVAQDDRFGYVAILEFGDLGERIGMPASTPDHAMVLLESELKKRRDLWCYGNKTNPR